MRSQCVSFCLSFQEYFSTEDHGTILTFTSFLQFYFIWLIITSIHFNNHLADRKSFQNETDVINKPNECVRQTMFDSRIVFVIRRIKSLTQLLLLTKKNITTQINEIYEAQLSPNYTLQVAVNRCRFHSVFKTTSVTISASDYFTSDIFFLKTTHHTWFTGGAKITIGKCVLVLC